MKVKELVLERNKIIKKPYLIRQALAEAAHDWIWKAETENAVIELSHGQLIWKRGTWYNGHWHGNIWHDGVWHNGWWHQGVWKNGIWHNGWWYGGEWLNGIKKNFQDMQKQEKQ